MYRMLYKKAVPSCFLCLIPFLVLMGSCSLTDSGTAVGSDDVFMGGAFSRASLAYRDLAWSLPLPFGKAEIEVGDLGGTGDPEILLRTGNGLTLYNVDGTPQRTGEVSGDVMIHSMILGDTDGDGKDDIILGADQDSAARLLVLNGFLDIQSEASFREIRKARTVPFRVKDRQIYFGAYSSMNIGPKILAAWNLGSSGLLWEQALGVIPLSLSISTGTGEATLDHWAPSHEYARQAPFSNDPTHQHRLLRFGPGGDRLGDFDYGPPVTSFSEESPRISALKTRLMDLNGDGIEEFLVLEEHFSSFYPGTTRLVALDSQGNEMFSYSGSAGDTGSFTTFFYEGELRIALLWERSGVMVLLDRSLREIGRRHLERRQSHRPGRLAAAGMFDGRNLHYLVVWDNQIQILDDSFGETGSVGFPGPVEDVKVFKDVEGRFQMAILADRLYVTGGDGGSGDFIAPHPPRSYPPLNPSGSSVLEPPSRESGVLRPPLYPAEPAAGYGALVLEEEIMVPPEYRYSVMGDFTGGPRLEAVFYSPQKASLRLYSWDTGEWSDLFTQQGTDLYIVNTGDMDGDAKEEMLLLDQEKMGFTVVRGNGEVLHQENLMRPFDSRIMDVVREGRLLHFRVDTGYLLTPRGIFSYDIDTWRRIYYRPLANKVFNAPPLVGEEGLYWPTFTPHNGLEIVNPEGIPESDSRLTLVALDRQGGPLPLYQQLTGESPVCYLSSYAWAPGDSPILFHVQSFAKGYYPGTPVIYTNSPGTDRLEPAGLGPQDARINRVFAISRGEDQALCFHWLNPCRVTIHDTAFHPLQELYTDAGAYDYYLWNVVDFDADGWSELLGSGGDRILIQNQSGDILWSVEGSPGTASRPFAADLKADGSPELVIFHPGRIEVYGY